MIIETVVTLILFARTSYTMAPFTVAYLSIRYRVKVWIPHCIFISIGCRRLRSLHTDPPPLRPTLPLFAYSFPLEPLYPVLRVIGPPNLAPVNLTKEWNIRNLVNSTVEFLRTSTTDVAGPFSTKTRDDVKGAREHTMRIVDFSGLWFSIPTSTTSTHDLSITMRPYSVRTMYNDLRDETGDTSTPVILTNTKRWQKHTCQTR